MTLDVPADRPLRVLHLCYSDGGGGATIGARRSHQAMLSQGLDSRLVVVEKTTDDPQVIELPRKPLRRMLALRMGQFVGMLQQSENDSIRSYNVVPMGTADVLNRMDADIIQMHWIAADTISVRELPKLNKPVVWKLPDMWAFSATEHYLKPGDPERFVEGYEPSNRPPHQWGLDVDRRLWAYKKHAWRDLSMGIVAPSAWMADCARRSRLFGKYPIRHILNPLDTALYKPGNTQKARATFDLPPDKSLIMFGAVQATSDRRKGFHHLQSALSHLNKHLDPIKTSLVVLGADGPHPDRIAGFEVRYLGTTHDENRVVAAYNAADALVLPCEMDNLPNVIKEAMCCGVPCAAFNVGGVPDMLDHQETGYLAKPYEAADLARGIGWAVSAAGAELRAKIRQSALEKFSPHKVVPQYIRFYRDILSDKDSHTLPAVPAVEAHP